VGFYTVKTNLNVLIEADFFSTSVILGLNLCVKE
jgi:hypothetical protein